MINDRSNVSALPVAAVMPPPTMVAPPDADEASAPIGEAPPDHTWHPDWRRPWNSTYNKFSSVSGAIGRHMLDSIGGLGMPGETWGARRAYRSSYSEEHRFGAQLGDMGTFAVLGVLGMRWQRSGFALPPSFTRMTVPKALAGRQLLGHTIAASVPMAPAVRGAIGAWMLAGAITAGTNLREKTIDEGNLAITGTGVGVAAGTAGAFLVGRRLPGRVLDKVVLGGMAFSGGHLGNALGERVDTGPGHMGDDRPVDAAPTLQDRPVLAFGRGLFNHGMEMGPITQGSSSGWSWKRQDAMEEWYSDPELVGGMLGDAAGVVFAGVAALVGINRALGRVEATGLRGTLLAQTMADLSVPSGLAGRFRGLRSLLQMRPEDVGKVVDRTTRTEQKKLGWRMQESIWGWVDKRALNYRGSVPQLLYLTAAGLGAYTIDRARSSGAYDTSLINERHSGILAGAMILGIGAAATKYAPIVKQQPWPVRPGLGLVAATMVTSAAFSVRAPVEVFVDGGANLHDSRGGPVLSPASVLAAGVGAGAGGVLGLRTAQLMRTPAWMRLGIAGTGAAATGAGLVAMTPLIDRPSASAG